MTGCRYLLLLGLAACSFDPRRAGGPADDTSSPDGAVNPIDDGASATDWWDTDFAYRARIVVTTTTAGTDADYSVMFAANTGELVAAGKAASTGDDWRVVRHLGPNQWQELDRWIDDANGTGWNGSDTRTWFAMPLALAADANDGETYVYYGAPDATAPPSDLDQVFVFGDDFESGLGKWTANNLGEQISTDGEHAGGAASFKIVTNGGNAAGIHRDIALPETTLVWSHFVRQAQTNESFAIARSFDCVYADRDPVTFVDTTHLRLATELDSGDKLQIWTNPLDNWSPAVTANEWHSVDTVFDGATNQVTARYDGGAWHSPPTTSTYDYLQGTQSLSIALEGEGGQNGTYWIDNFIIRRFADPEPTAALDAEQARP